MKRYKFLVSKDNKIKSYNGDCEWKIKEKKIFNGDLSMCKSGFHCSKTIYQAFSYVQGDILAEVEVGGNKIISDNKEVYSEMKILRAWKWKKEDSVALAIYSAELVLKNFEKVYPNDKRPREAIEAAKRYLKELTEENRSAAKSAAMSAESAAMSAESATESAMSAAWSAMSAESAAESAKSAAWSAKYAARSAAESAKSAAWSAMSAAWSAWSAAESAWSAESNAIKKIQNWMSKRKLQKYD